MTDGSEFETRSTWGKENDVLKLDIDPKSHYAWTGGAQKILDKSLSHKLGGETFFITNDAPTYFWTLARTVWKADGHIDKYNIVLNRPVAIVAGYLSEFFSKLLKKEPGLTPFRVKVVCAYRYHDISKAKNVLGYKPQVDLETGIKYTLDWMNESS